MPAESARTVVIDRAGLQALLEALGARGYTVIAPTVRDGAIVYDEIDAVDDLPAGDHRRAGRRLVPPGGTRRCGAVRVRGRPALVEEVPVPAGGGALSRPARPRPRLRRRGRRRRDGAPLRVPRCARVRDRGDRHPGSGVPSRFVPRSRLRDRAATVRSSSWCSAASRAAHASACRCTPGHAPIPGSISRSPSSSTPSATSSSSRSAPSAARRSWPTFPRGRLGPTISTPRRPSPTVPRAAWAGRSKPTGCRNGWPRCSNIHSGTTSPSRCLACTNCTLVCPTCFCSSVEDTTDLTGTEATRTRKWDSCFTLGHSYIHGGSTRASTRDRYRQWLTHKLSTWVDQFGTSGCVGCGRCITWCPVGIDITAEVRALLTPT